MHYLIELVVVVCTGKKCIAHVVCSGAHVDIARWEEFRDVVREEVRIRRNSCTTAIKKQYMRKFMMMVT